MNQDPKQEENDRKLFIGPGALIVIKEIRKMIPIQEQITALEIKREKLHTYTIMKLEEHDYHGVADAAMDLREVEREITTLKRISSSM